MNPVNPRGSCATGICARYAPVLFAAIAIVSIGFPRAGIAEDRPGTLILVGDVLPFNQGNVWNRITENAADMVIIAAASDRPKLYGEFARRALERHGAFAELLPLAVDPAEFGVDWRRVVVDPAMVEKVRDASGVFFVGGAPQRLAEVLFHTDGSPSPVTRAVADAYANGAVVVGGIPGSTGLATGVDAYEVLARGRVPPAQLFRGLELVSGGWFVDQHAFSPGRLAEILVAMRQLGLARGIGIGPDTSAVIDEGKVEVVGDEGVVLIDLSSSRAAPDASDEFRLAGARLSYLEHGDVFDMSTLEIRPAAAKLSGFEIDPVEIDRESSEPPPRVAGDLLAEARLPELLREALDGSGHEVIGLASRNDASNGEQGFRFRFHSVPETIGWLSVESGPARYTIVNLGLEISFVGR